MITALYLHQHLMRLCMPTAGLTEWRFAAEQDRVEHTFIALLNRRVKVLISRLLSQSVWRRLSAFGGVRSWQATYLLALIRRTWGK